VKSLRDLITGLGTRLDETDALVRQTQVTLSQRDEAHAQALARISALEVLTGHLKPKRPERVPVPYPGPGDPPRKNVRRMVPNPDVRPNGPNGQHAVGCVYCGKLLCSPTEPKCARAKRVAEWR
jgi:hypothetical protein